jgi:hypothetical protein
MSAHSLNRVHGLQRRIAANLSLNPTADRAPGQGLATVAAEGYFNRWA